MTQIVLSEDLLQLAAEIAIYKQQAGQAVFEIGRRLKHVKDNDLAHGQWTAWLESVDINPRTARAMIQAFEQFGNRQTSTDLPTGKIFEMLSLPESIDREQFLKDKHTIPSTGEEKTVEDMTVKELREVKKQLQEETEQRKKAEQDARHWQGVAKSQPVRVQTQVVEKLPEDYEDLKQQAIVAQRLNTENVQLKRSINEQREQYEQKLTQEDKRKSVNKDLKKFCQELLQNQGMYTEAILYNLSLNLGDRECAQIIEAFQVQYSHEVQVFMTKIKQMTTVRTVS